MKSARDIIEKKKKLTCLSTSSRRLGNPTVTVDGTSLNFAWSCKVLVIRMTSSEFTDVIIVLKNFILSKILLKIISKGG